MRTIVVAIHNRSGSRFWQPLATTTASELQPTVCHLGVTVHTRVYRSSCYSFRCRMICFVWLNATCLAYLFSLRRKEHFGHHIARCNLNYWMMQPTPYTSEHAEDLENNTLSAGKKLLGHRANLPALEEGTKRLKRRIMRKSDQWYLFVRDSLVLFFSFTTRGDLIACPGRTFPVPLFVFTLV